MIVQGRSHGYSRLLFGLCRHCRQKRRRRHAIQGVTTQGCDNISYHLSAHSHLCLDGGGSQVWCCKHPFVCKHLSQYGIIAYGFLTEDIERHSCQSTLGERSQQRLFVYQDCLVRSSPGRHPA